MKANQDEEKKNVNKALKKLSVEDVANIFVNKKLPQLVDVIRKNKVDGKLLNMMKAAKDFEQLELVFPPGPTALRPIIDIEGWRDLGVDKDLLKNDSKDGPSGRDGGGGAVGNPIQVELKNLPPPQLPTVQTSAAPVLKTLPPPQLPTVQTSAAPVLPILQSSQISPTPTAPPSEIPRGPGQI